MNKVKLFKNTYDKLCNDRAFMAFYLHEVSLKENKTPDEMAALLNCSLEDYYKLALCKAPEINSEFDTRINKIAAYTNSSPIILSNIVHYSTVAQQPKERGLFDKLLNLITLPDWFDRSQAKVYQAVISICVIILVLFSYVPEKSETKNSQLYANAYFSYTDSIKYTQVQDNTYVHKNNL